MTIDFSPGKSRYLLLPYETENKPAELFTGNRRQPVSVRQWKGQAVQSVCDEKQSKECEFL